ncbi:MAG: hypothetical protein MUO76_09465 [Anaerolineaceae bacterium]|nr:hypothetical protein [Anaerolineaceae bacterium]
MQRLFYRNWEHIDFITPDRFGRDQVYMAGISIGPGEKIAEEIFFTQQNSIQVLSIDGSF